MDAAVVAMVAENASEPASPAVPAQGPEGRHDRWCLRCRTTGHLAADCPENPPAEPDAFTDPTAAADANQAPKLPPEVTAQFDSTCDTCALDISEGDQIRATGDGGWECAFHAEERLPAGEEPITVNPQPAPETVPLVEIRLPVAPKPAPAPDPFTSPTRAPSPNGSAPAAPTGPIPPSAPLPFGKPEPAPVPEFADPTPVTPKRKQTVRNGYLAKDPTIGDFRRFKNGNIKPITRVSTFIKAASDRTALTEWNCRNVLLGSVHFPQMAAEAKALHPHPEGPLPEDKDTKQALNRIVDRVSEMVGSKRAADRGTEIHQSVEDVAKGKKTLEEIPTDHVPWVRAFLACLKENGLRLLPDMVERTVFIPQFGGIMGRFDQAVEEIATRRVLMSDVKTGSLDYAWQEIQGQLALYVAGYTQYGTYEWDMEDERRDRWVAPARTLDATEGIVFHMPVKDGEPVCHAERVDLRQGWEHVELCARNREAAAQRLKPTRWSPNLAPAVPEPALVPTHLYDDGNGGLWEHPGSPSDCAMPECAQAPGSDNPWWTWESRFQEVNSPAEAGALWESARAAGVPEPELQRLTGVAMERLQFMQDLARDERDSLAIGAGSEPPF
jgi:hypothetical protein